MRTGKISPNPACCRKKVRNYKATRNNIEYDVPLEVRYCPHHAQIHLIKAPTEIQHNAKSIFMDGSKIGVKVGAAAVIIKNDSSSSIYVKQHEICCNNQAEQVAILKAMVQIQNLQLT